MKPPVHWAFHAIRSKRVCGARVSNWPAAWAMFCATAAESHKARGSLPLVFSPPPELPAGIDNLLLQDGAASIFLRLGLGLGAKTALSARLLARFKLLEREVFRVSHSAPVRFCKREDLILL